MSLTHGAGGHFRGDINPINQSASPYPIQWHIRTIGIAPHAAVFYGTVAPRPEGLGNKKNSLRNGTSDRNHSRHDNVISGFKCAPQTQTPWRTDASSETKQGIL